MDLTCHSSVWFTKKCALNISAKKSLYTIYLNNLKSIIMCIIFPGNGTFLTSTTEDNFSGYFKFLMNEFNEILLYFSILIAS